MCLRIAIFLPSPVPRPSARRSPCDRRRKSAPRRTTPSPPRADAWSHHAIRQTRMAGPHDIAAQRRSPRRKLSASPPEEMVSPLVALLLLTGLPVRTLSLSTSTPAKPVRIACPKDRTTRIVFPEPFLPGGVRVSRGATDAMGIVLEASRPTGVITIRPESHPARGTVTLRGPSILVTLVLWTAEEGIGSEIRVVAPGPSDNTRPAAAAADPVDHSRAARSSPGRGTSGDRPTAPSSLSGEPAGVMTDGKREGSEARPSLAEAKPPSSAPADDAPRSAARTPRPLRSDDIAKTAQSPRPARRAPPIHRRLPSRPPQDSRSGNRVA